MTLPSPTGTLGFPQQVSRQPPEFGARPTPLPKRPKGRWFVGLILLGFCSFAGYQVWQAYFRYQAYGTVTGRTIHVSSAQDGVVQYLHVRQGDKVRQGQLLLTVDNLSLRQRAAQLDDDLTIAQATLEAEAAKLKWQSAYSLDQGRGAVAAYYEALGTLLQEQSRLEDMTVALQRTKQLERRAALPREELDHAEFTRQGQERKVTRMRQALAEMKKRADQADALLKKGGDLGQGLEASGRDQLKPALARIQALLAEKTRLRETLGQGEIRAPTNGTVVKSLRFVGEACKSAEPLLTLLEEGSLQVVLYLPQEVSNRFAVGNELRLVVAPNARRLGCTLVRFGEEFEPAPEHIKHHYREGQKLLLAYLQPEDDDADAMNLRLNEVVKLPSDLLNLSMIRGVAQ